MPSLLERLEAQCNVDVDDASTQVIQSIPFTPHNQTSNQVIITGELLKPENEALLKDLVAKHGDKGWEAVYNQASVALCARNVALLSGRVLIQVSLRYVHDIQATLAQCREYAAAFEAAGVSRDRFAIKIPFSGAGAAASKILNQEGIRTLATAVFSVEQAVAASQAGCVMISPYYNEIAAHADEKNRISVKDVALEHPMSPRIVRMHEFFAQEQARTGKPQPIMVIASHPTPEEIPAMVELGCSHITISAANLKALLETEDPNPPFTGTKHLTSYEAYKTLDRLAGLATTDPLSGEFKPLVETDWLANEGEKLKELIEQDAVLNRRFKDAETLFLGAEEKARVAIEGVINA